ncbi:MAG: hypothetical protein WCH43_15510, partial [Verrucomicrobiota bacterium]
MPNPEVIADLQGKRVFITEDVHNTGESWIAFARMLIDNGVEVLGVATLVSTEQRITSPRDIERLSEKVAAALGKEIDEVQAAMHSLFDGTFKQLFNKAEAEVSRSNTRRNVENSGKLFDIASSGRRAGAYSNPLQSGDGSGGEVLGGDGLSQDTFSFSIGNGVVIDYLPTREQTPDRRDSQSEIRSLRKRQEDVAARSAGTNEAERFRNESESLVSWAEENGRLIDPEKWADRVGSWEKLVAGLEHFVFRDDDSSRVIKITKPFNYGAHGRSETYLKNLEYNNRLFGDDIRLEGVLNVGEGRHAFAAIVISQPFIDGTEPTLEEIAAWMDSQGFDVKGGNVFVSRNQRIEVMDAHTGNLIKTAGGELVPIDLLIDVSADVFNSDPSSFSLGPAQVAGIMSDSALKRITDPRRRTYVMSKISKDFNAMRLQIERISSLSGMRRSKNDLKREAMAREDLAAEEKIAAIHARFGLLLADEDLVKIKSQPVHAHMADPETPLRGRLMSKAAAIKAHPERYQLHRGGEYDGSEGVSRSVFGGRNMPDQMAQELFDHGLIQEPTADAMWEALLSEQKTVAGMKEMLL